MFNNIIFKKRRQQLTNIHRKKYRLSFSHPYQFRIIRYRGMNIHFMLRIVDIPRMEKVLPIRQFRKMLYSI